MSPVGNRRGKLSRRDGSLQGMLLHAWLPVRTTYRWTSLQNFYINCSVSEKLVQLVRVIEHDIATHQSSHFIVYFATCACVDYFYRVRYDIVSVRIIVLTRVPGPSQSPVDECEAILPPRPPYPNSPNPRIVVLFFLYIKLHLTLDTPRHGCSRSWTRSPQRRRRDPV